MANQNIDRSQPSQNLHTAQKEAEAQVGHQPWRSACRGERHKGVSRKVAQRTSDMYTTAEGGVGRDGRQTGRWSTFAVDGADQGAEHTNQTLHMKNQ